MAASKDVLIKQLEKVIPGIVFFDHDEFGISAEEGTEVEGMPLADYYDGAYWDPNEHYMVMGIHRKVRFAVSKCGWRCEWINPGMIGLYQD